MFLLTTIGYSLRSKAPSKKSYVNYSVGNGYQAPKIDQKCKHKPKKTQRICLGELKVMTPSMSICSSVKTQQKKLNDVSDNYSITESEIDPSLLENAVVINLGIPNKDYVTNPRVKSYLVQEVKEPSIRMEPQRRFYVQPPQNSTISIEQEESQYEDEEINYENLKIIQGKLT